MAHWSLALALVTWAVVVGLVMILLTLPPV